MHFSGPISVHHLHTHYMLEGAARGSCALQWSHFVLLLVAFAVPPTSCEHAYFFLCVHARVAGLRALTMKSEAERKESKAKRNKQPALLYPTDAGDNLREELCADDRCQVQTFCLRAVAQ